MSEQYQEDTSSSSKKPVKPKHGFKKAFSRRPPSANIGDAINPASVLLDDLINTLTSLYMNTKKQ